MLNCNNLLILIIILGLLLLFKKTCKMTGGANENTIVKELETMIKNKDLKENQKLEKLKSDKVKLEDDVKKKLIFIIIY